MATSLTPAIPESAGSTRTPTDSFANTCPQRHGLPDAHTQGGPRHHGQTQQPAPQMPWLQDAQSGILWDQTTYCTSELNPRGLFYYLLV
jgi:hypothetical protein